MTKSKDSAIADLLEQARNCSDIAADQHELADGQLTSTLKSVEKQHKNAEKLEMLGEALVDEAAEIMGTGEIKISEQSTRPITTMKTS